MTSVSYQQTLLYAKVTFVCPGMPSHTVYMTPVVSFLSSNKSVGVVNGNTLHGVGLGSLLVSVRTYGPGPMVVTGALVHVGTSSVKVSSLSVILITSLSSESNGHLSADRQGLVSPVFVAVQSLVAEGNQANAVVVAR